MFHAISHSEISEVLRAAWTATNDLSPQCLTHFDIIEPNQWLFAHSEHGIYGLTSNLCGVRVELFRIDVLPWLISYSQLIGSESGAIG